MRYYTETIPFDLAEKLKEKGMPLGSCVWMPNGMASRKDEANLAYYDDQLIPYCKYAEVFDWLMDKGMMIHIGPLCELVNSGWVFDYTITYNGGSDEIYSEGPSVPWIDAANAAIRKALELLAD